MAQHTSNPDVVIVGAGAAGVGAGLALTRLGIPFVILEAKDRVGGRAYSETHSLGHLWDHGCHWMHAAERNPLRRIADRIGHPYLARVEQWARSYHVDGRKLTGDEQDAAWEAVQSAFEACDAAGEAGRDISQAEAAHLSGPYAPFIRFIFEAIGAGPADDISALDAWRYDGGDTDFPVSGGYGALIERLAAGLPLRLGCPVQAITTLPGGVDVHTSDGTLRATAVILTISNGVLASGRIALSPALPPALVSALGDVPLGHCEKIAVEIAGEALAEHASTSILALEGGRVVSLQLRPFGRPIVTSYLAGALAQEMGRASDADATAFLTDVLAGIFGTELRRQIRRGLVTRWSEDPHILGAYTYCRAGRASARDALISADLAPIYLAGEAYSLPFYSTCHGAFVSGTEAAHKAAGRLGAQHVDPDPLWLPAALTGAPPAAK